MSRIALSRMVAVAAALAGAAACSSPTFSATGAFASERGPACVYCGNARGYIPPFATNRTAKPTQEQSDAGRMR